MLTQDHTTTKWESSASVPSLSHFQTCALHHHLRLRVLVTCHIFTTYQLMTLGTDSNSLYLDFLIHKYWDLMPRRNGYQIWALIICQGFFKGLCMSPVAIIILIYAQ